MVSRKTTMDIRRYVASWPSLRTARLSKSVFGSCVGRIFGPEQTPLSLPPFCGGRSCTLCFAPFSRGSIRGSISFQCFVSVRVSKTLPENGCLPRETYSVTQTLRAPLQLRARSPACVTATPAASSLPREQTCAPRACTRAASCMRGAPTRHVRRWRRAHSMRDSAALAPASRRPPAVARRPRRARRAPARATPRSPPAPARTPVAARTHRRRSSRSCCWRG